MIFSKPDTRVEVVFVPNKALIIQELFYLKLPAAVVSSLQHAECEGVEQNLAQPHADRK